MSIPNREEADSLTDGLSIQADNPLAHDGRAWPPASSPSVLTLETYLMCFHVVGISHHPAGERDGEPCPERE
jgi:hypothetical protein